MQDLEIVIETFDEETLIIIEGIPVDSIPVSRETGNQIVTKSDGVYVPIPYKTPVVNTLGDSQEAVISQAGSKSIDVALREWVNIGLSDLSSIKVSKENGKGLLLDSERVRLHGMATEATKNETDSYLLDRNHHTGEQPQSTVTGLPQRLDAVDIHLGSIDTTLGTKVDKIIGKGLSENDYTDADVLKLSGIAPEATKNRSDGASDVLLSGKVDKITGKGLSTNDYSTVEKTKLSGVATGATKNSTDLSLRDRTTHTGVQPPITITGLPAAMSKLDGIAIEATKNRSDEASDVLLSGKVDKVVGKGLSSLDYTEGERFRLMGIEVGATKNSTDEMLRDRNTHTGEIPIIVVTGLSTALDGKVGKVVGKGLSERDYTTEEKSKLAGLEDSKYKGMYTSVGALPVGGSGFYADVDSGGGITRWIFDGSSWVEQSVATSLTPSQIKQMYESNPDTNSFSNSDKLELNNLTDMMGDVSALLIQINGT